MPIIKVAGRHRPLIPLPHLDGQYAAFGKITENVEAAVEISKVSRSMSNDRPKEAQVIASIPPDGIAGTAHAVAVGAAALDHEPWDHPVEDQHGNIFNRDPERPRRLLMHKREINRLQALVQQDGYAHAVAVGAAALDHEPWDHPVEDQTVIIPAIGQRNKIVHRIGRLLLLHCQEWRDLSPRDAREPI